MIQFPSAAGNAASRCTMHSSGGWELWMSLSSRARSSVSSNPCTWHMISASVPSAWTNTLCSMGFGGGQSSRPSESAVVPLSGRWSGRRHSRGHGNSGSSGRTSASIVTTSSGTACINRSATSRACSADARYSAEREPDSIRMCPGPDVSSIDQNHPCGVFARTVTMTAIPVRSHHLVSLRLGEWHLGRFIRPATNPRSRIR